MKFAWFCFLFFVLILAIGSAKDQYFDIPITECTGSNAIMNSTAKLTKVSKNIAFVYKGVYYGPANCNFVVKYKFITSDAKDLKVAVVINGTKIPIEIDACFNTKPACENGHQQEYSSQTFFPFFATTNKFGEAFLLVYLKQHGKKVACYQATGYYFKASCCY